MPSSSPSPKTRGRCWVTIQKNAFCDDCQWHFHGAGHRLGYEAVQIAARDHHDSTGHRVVVERGQSFVYATAVSS